MARFYRLGIPPFTPILHGLIFTDKHEAIERARQENRYGDYKGRGVKVYPCTEDGSLTLGGVPTIIGTRY